MTTYSVPIIARLLNARWGLLQMPPMFYMTDEERAPDPLLNINRLEPGTGVILRHYNIKSRFELGLEVKMIKVSRSSIAVDHPDDVLRVEKAILERSI